jgi:hypothetical protein
MLLLTEELFPDPQTPPTPNHGSGDQNRNPQSHADSDLATPVCFGEVSLRSSSSLRWIGVDASGAARELLRKRVCHFIVETKEQRAGIMSTSAPGFLPDDDGPFHRSKQRRGKWEW